MSGRLISAIAKEYRTAVNDRERTEQMEVELLAGRAKSGDKDAFLELMLMHKEYLYRTAYLYVRNSDTACELVQECIVKSMESIGKLKKPEFFKSWITKILINCAITQLRKDKRYAAEPEWVSGEWAEKEGPVSREEKMDLYLAIDRLEYPYKVIIIQKYFFDCQLNEIASFLQMPLGTVKAYHSRAKKQLRAYLEE